MRPSVLFVLALLAAPQAAADVAVTVYPNDLGFVRETRTLSRGARGDTVAIDGLPDRLDFASLRVIPAGGARVTRLARRDEVQHDDALARAVGRSVRVILRGDRAIEGTLARADGAWIVVREAGGAVQALARGSVDAVAIAEPGDWPAAETRPAPAVHAVLAGGRGDVDAELTYLTGGLSWEAEHRLVRTDEGKGTWASTAIVRNASGRDYADAALTLVAGDPNRVAKAPVPMRRAVAMEMAAAPMADLAEQSFSEYHMYSLDRPATLADGEEQQLSMLVGRDVTFTPRYRYRGGDPAGVRLELELANVRGAGLGAPVPGGRVRIYERDAAGVARFAGEANVAHAAEGETLRVAVGAVFDVAAERRELDRRRIADREREATVAITLRNRKKRAVTVEVDEPASGEVTVVKSSHPAERPDAGTIRFSVAVKPGESVTVQYTARTRY